MDIVTGYPALAVSTIPSVLTTRVISLKHGYKKLSSLLKKL